MAKGLGRAIRCRQAGDDALLLPGDDLAQAFTSTDGKQLQTSFRYFHEPIHVAGEFGGGGDMLLIEIRPRRFERLMLANDGRTPTVFGEPSRWSVDRFGK